ncbi:MAG: hypothetical protein F4124_00985 [Acidimicrobiia bacterium]|nr:hypothetical protein [Acidimicrobiia bacterium]MYB72365.1 hypothetical protein [Acidimicrobiia bacterium]MYH97992.1 hypothetical protein [Acidimicrobiia bacterium]
MQSAIVQMILIVVGIAVAAIVSIVVYNQVSDRAETVNDQTDVIYDFDTITNETLCVAVKGTWDDANDSCSG